MSLAQMLKHVAQMNVAGSATIFQGRKHRWKETMHCVARLAETFRMYSKGAMR